MRFNRKGYGRIYTDTEANAARIHDLIREADTDEYDYLPADLIAVDNCFDETVYNGKFYDFDLDALMARCEREGIPCRVIVRDERRVCPHCEHEL